MSKLIPLLLSLTALCLVAGCSSSSCRDGEQKCSGACVNFQTDPAHCGACDQACGGSEVCDRGTCSGSCSGGLVACERRCVDPLSDPDHCGGCGKACGAGQSCSLGSCLGGQDPDSQAPLPGDAGVIDDADAAPICVGKPVAIKTNGTLDLDLKVVQLSGRLTKNGAKVPDGNAPRGRIELVRLEDGGVVRMPDFSPTGEATYQGELAAGTYDIYYEPATTSTSACEQLRPLPCQRVRLREEIAVKTNGTLDLDIKIVQLSGRLTKNGAKVPDHLNSANRGRIELERHEDNGRARMPMFSATGEATYQGEIAAGTYDIYYEPTTTSTSACEQGRALPCQRFRLRDKIAVKTNGTLDLDAKIVQLSGRLTKNGAKVPDHLNSAKRGRIELERLEDDSIGRMPSFAASGEATYQGEIAAGTYDIYYEPTTTSTSACEQGRALPCQRFRLRDKIAVKTNGTLDLDAKIVQLSGRLTKNGAKVPDHLNSAKRGRIELERLEDDSIGRMPMFSATGETTYQGEIAAGTYDIYYEPTTTSTSACEQGRALPCQRFRLREKIAVKTNGTLDLDAKIVQLSGRLTKNGAKVPDHLNSAKRGRIELERLEDDSIGRMPSFGPSGEATYQGEIAAGTYDIFYEPTTVSSSACDQDRALPCQRARLRTKIAVKTNGTLDLDAKIVQLSGRLTKNGAKVPDEVSGTRGRLRLVRDEDAGQRQMKQFNPTSEATYQGELFAGDYDIYYSAATNCDPRRTPPPAMPCQEVLLKGCAHYPR